MDVLAFNKKERRTQSVLYDEFLQTKELEWKPVGNSKEKYRSIQRDLEGFIKSGTLVATREHSPIGSHTWIERVKERTFPRS